MTSITSRRSQRRYTNRIVSAAVAGAVALALSACTVKKQEPPPFSGPSELGTSITPRATPDTLNQDGSSQSLIDITVRNADGQPMRNMALRLEIWVNGIPVDFGRLSARNVVTGTDGRASAIYTAPPAPPEAVDTFTTVSIIVIPSGTNFADAVPRRADIRLVPPGVILPPNGTPVPAFTHTQPALEETPIQFDGSASRDDGTIVSYSWSFGDGSSGSGVRVNHTYELGGVYSVTLTVTDDRGLRASTTQSVTVGATADPSASFSSSPGNPRVDETVFFNASASRASTGREIVAYDWTFGDGATGTGRLTQHTYDRAGTYNVTLTVTDDAGKTDSQTQTVGVGQAQNPTAVFVFSPSNPAALQPVNFSASTSTVPPGRTIVSYEWNFGDGTVGNGENVTHIYATGGTYVVTLRITDSTGAVDTMTRNVPVN